MAVSLPTNPNLEHFRRDARRLQRAVRAGDSRALAIVARFHPDGRPTDADTFPLSAAQLVVARGYGFSSWARLKHYFDDTVDLRRDLTKVRPETLADRVSERACLQYTEADDPARWAEAAAVLEANPSLVDDDVAVAAVAGDADTLRHHLAADPGTATREAGPFRWPPLLYLVYARVPQHDPVAAARLLLDAGADPSTGYLWGGLPSPFTALTGCFGEGEQGPGRQPRHPEGETLARLLLDRGADANDGQTLYNRMFGRDDSHLVLLFEYGLGQGDGGVWRRRLGEATESPAEMMARQLDWAQQHGFDRRLALLAEHGFRPEPTPNPTSASVHRAGSPEAVAAAVAAGADVDAYEDGRTALHHHAWIGDAEMVRALLAVGADPNLVDAEHGTTPLGWAEYGRQPETEAILRSVTGSTP
ncbi:MAG TPA: ankyrin repeat domain-containing protein [Lapillicoccus sp.]|nr:ankyrin repeat domain-containing protein [Lapillicoccus sp.]